MGRVAHTLGRRVRWLEIWSPPPSPLLPSHPPYPAAIPLILRSAVNFQGQEDKGLECRLGGRSELRYTGNPAETPCLDSPAVASTSAKEKIPLIRVFFSPRLPLEHSGTLLKTGVFQTRVCLRHTRTCTYYTGIYIYMEERKPRQRGAQVPPGCWEAGKTPGDAPRRPVACFYRGGD